MTVDCETTGLDWTTDRLHGFSVGFDEDSAVYYRVDEVPTSVMRDLADPEIDKLGANFHKFDAKFLEQYLKQFGLRLGGEFHDIETVWNLIDPDDGLGLKYLADRELGPGSLEKKKRLDEYLKANGCRHVGELCAKDLLDPSRPHTRIIAEYGVEDNLNTTRVFNKGMERLREMDEVLKGPKYGFKKSPLDYYYEESLPLERVLHEIEYHGIRINLEFIEKLRDMSLARMNEIETSLNKVFVNRIPKVETELCEKLRAEVTTEKAKQSRQPGKGKAKFKWGNKNHVASLLFNYCDLPPEMIRRTEKGAFKIDKEVVAYLIFVLDQKKSPLAGYLRLYAEYKKHEKIAKTYTGTTKKGIYSKIRFVNTETGEIRRADTIPDGPWIARIFPQYAATSGTGRLKCKNPNLQNLKRDSDVKKIFIPDDPSEVFDDGDYSQIELRDGAHLSQDPGLVNSYLTGEDVHLRTASRLFGKVITKKDDLERQAGKRTNFLTIFDGKAKRLQSALKADTGKDFTLEECDEFIRLWFEEYPTVRDYLDSQIEFFKKHKFCIAETGRIRRLPDIIFGAKLRWIKDKKRDKWVPRYEGPPHLREDLIKSLRAKDKTSGLFSEERIGWEARRRYQHAIKAGLNQPIQSLAASKSKRAMVKLHKMGRRVANQVHDSLTVPRKRKDFAARDQFVDIMKNIYKLTVPVEVDVKTLNSFHPKDKSDD